MLVTRMAQMVPTGIDLEASARSPDRLEPAIMPAGSGAGTRSGEERIVGLIGRFSF